MTARHVLPVLAFLAVSAALSASWPAISARAARVIDGPVARALVRTSARVIWSDHTLEGDRVVVLTNNRRHLLAPALAGASSLALPTLAGLLAAVFVAPRARRSLATGSGRRALVVGILGVFVVEMLAAWSAISYAFSVDVGEAPGRPLRLATVALNASRAFVPFVAVAIAYAVGTQDLSGATESANPDDLDHAGHAGNPGVIHAGR